MMNLPSICPLDTAGGPISSTIIAVGAPALVAVVVLLGVFAVVVVGVALRARSARRPKTATPAPGLVPSYGTSRLPR
jgi:hypothetical protein